MEFPGPMFDEIFGWRRGGVRHYRSAFITETMAFVTDGPIFVTFAKIESETGVCARCGAMNGAQKVTLIYYGSRFSSASVPYRKIQK